MTSYIITLNEVVEKQYRVAASSEEEGWEMITDDDGSHTAYRDDVEGIQYLEDLTQDLGEILDDRTTVEEEEIENENNS